MTRDSIRRVYFIKPVGMHGPVKIGCSCSPTGRRDTLQTWSPFPLEIVAEIRGDFIMERRFHSLFHAQHQGREWFAWSQSLQTVIEAVIAGSFDTSTLPEPRVLPRAKKNGNGWTERTRQMQSYAGRIRHIEKKHQRFLPMRLHGWRAFLDDPKQMAPIEAFISDPNSNGLSRAERNRELADALRGNPAAWAQRRLAELEAAA